MTHITFDKGVYYIHGVATATSLETAIWERERMAESELHFRRFIIWC